MVSNQVLEGVIPQPELPGPISSNDQSTKRHDACIQGIHERISDETDTPETMNDSLIEEVKGTSSKYWIKVDNTSEENQ